MKIRLNGKIVDVQDDDDYHPEAVIAWIVVLAAAYLAIFVVLGWTR